jgi:glucose/arabinose dehydrogenase
MILVYLLSVNHDDMMIRRKLLPLVLFFLLILVSCNMKKLNKGSYKGSATTSGYKADSLPTPYATGSAKNFSLVEGWKGKTPIAPSGFSVTPFAEGLDHPRWIYVADNNDVFVAESNTVLKGLLKIGAKLSRKIRTEHEGTSANRIILFRDIDVNGQPRKKFIFLDHLKQPFGMLVLGHTFYVANTDGLMAYDYRVGDTVCHGKGRKIVNLPAGKYNRHWTRNIITNEARDKIYIAVGSGTNVAEKGLANEVRRANILEVNPDGTGERIYASGLRNPVGMGWAPHTKTLWTSVNERDYLGDELVPDYLTGVKEGGFYGWPFSYFGRHEDPRMKDQQRPDLVEKAIIPDVPLGSHTASLGLAFYDKKSFPEKYHNGAFVTQHGSYNRSVISGYKVVFVPFRDGRPSGPPEDFLTGFVDNQSKSEVYGRPVGITVLNDGSMLLADDASNVIWRISAVPR